MTLNQNDLVAKEEHLGAIREMPVPSSFLYPTLAPLREVASDEVTFSYLPPDVSGLAPARAEDAESELAMKDDYVGQGRASILDWAIKDTYKASQISRYRDYKRMAELLAGRGPFPLTIDSMTEDFEAVVARDTALRKRKLDNRLELLTIGSLFTGATSYNDGKITYSVSWGRPGGQTAAAPPNGLWSLTTSDPIGDINAMNKVMYDTYGVVMTRAITSTEVLRNCMNSSKFIPLTGMAGATGSAPVDPNYLINGWGPQAAVAVIERATGVTFQAYDAFYRTRALGSTTPVINRFSDKRDILFLPSEEAMMELSELGLGKTLTSPHPEGNWTAGFYGWETPERQDPWGKDMGTGIKAFPVFPTLEYTYSMRVLA